MLLCVLIQAACDQYLTIFIGHIRKCALFTVTNIQNIRESTLNSQAPGNKIENGRRFKAQKREKSS